MGFRTHLLSLASRPDTRLEEVLRLTLGRAVSVTGSTTGTLTLVVPRSQNAHLALCPDEVHQVWQGESPRPDLSRVVSAVPTEVLQTARPLRIDDHADRGGPDAPQNGARASVWVPLVEGRKQVWGILQVAAQEAEHYSDSHLAALERLASEALPGLHRAFLKQRLAEAGFDNDVFGVSPAFVDLEREIQRSALYVKGPVLITGERGSGKELAARAIHAWSRRHRRPFVPVLASALPENLVAAELFGHEKNSFTGAAGERRGKFGAAEGGTLFLDEVADLPPPVQASLMRIIDQGELQRVGRDLPLATDVQIVAATNRPLEELRQGGSIRRDLFDRLAVGEIRVPPLRARREDISLLASAFLTRQCRQLGRRGWLAGDGVCGACECTHLVSCIGDDFFAALEAYEWPGNVRELENVTASLMAHTPDDVLTVEHLPRHLRNGEPPRQQDREDLQLQGVVKSHIEYVLDLAENNQSRAAELLGLPLSTLRNKMKRLGIVVSKAHYEPA